MDKKLINGLRTWIEIDTGRLHHNYQVLRRVAPASRLMAVCKSNAYGHGLIDFARAVETLGVDWLGLDSILEALKLRQSGLKSPMLVLGYTLPEMVREAAANNISLTVSSFDALRALAPLQATGLRIHLKFDTGMCRQGFFPEEAAAVFRFADEELSGVEVEGVFTHFAGAKNPAFPQGTKEQIAKFQGILDLVPGDWSVLRHAAATSGAIVFPEAQLDVVRVGIGLYGLWPSQEVQYAYNDKFQLQPILTWKTVIAEIKRAPAGARVGYDFTELLERPTVIGILPVGYWHSYDRSLSSIGKVLVNGHRARILGRVSMDMVTVDLTDIPAARVGDEVVLLGEQNGAVMSADEMAMLAGTSGYEIVTRLNPLIKRIYF